jgi:hypothetical protein
MRVHESISGAVSRIIATSGENHALRKRVASIPTCVGPGAPTTYEVGMQHLCSEGEAISRRDDIAVAVSWPREKYGGVIRGVLNKPVQVRKFFSSRIGWWPMSW